MFISLLFVCLSVCLSVCLPVCLSVVNDRFCCRCGSSDINQWHSEATPITSLSINSLTDWLRDQISTSSSLASESIPYDKTAVLEAVLMAMADKKVESVYFITNGKFLTSGEETFRRKV